MNTLSTFGQERFCSKPKGKSVRCQRDDVTVLKQRISVASRTPRLSLKKNKSVV